MRRARAVGAAARWLAPAGVLIGGAALAVVLQRPAGARGLVESGVAYMVAAYDLVLPLVGLGVALATLARWQAALFAIVFAAAVPGGVLGEHRLLATALLPPELARNFVYLGPLCCVAAGLALAAAGRPRLWFVAVAAALSGAALGFLAALHDPAAGDPGFAVGAAAAGLWLIATPPTILRLFHTGWLRIGSRILASWLVAIGLLLGGAKLVMQRRAAQAPTQALMQPPAPSSPSTGEGAALIAPPREGRDPSREP